ncbi:WD40-repeat-containing domain protein, partial [Zopfochytrium polystomum]
PLFVLRGHAHGASVTAAAFVVFTTAAASGSSSSSSEGNLSDSRGPIPSLASCDSEGACILWNLQNYRPIHQWAPHSASILNVSLAPGSTPESILLLTQGRDDALHLWNVTETLRRDRANGENAAPALIYTLPVGSLNFCRFDSCLHGTDILVAVPNVLVSEQLDGMTEASKRTGICMAVRFLRRNLNSASSTASSDLQDLWLLAGYEAGNVILWNVGSKEEAFGLKVFNEPVICLTISNDGLLAFAGAAEEKIVSISISANELKTANTVSIPNCKGVSEVSVRRDGKLVIAGCWDNSIRLFSAKRLSPLATFRHPHRQGISCIEMVAAADPARLPITTDAPHAGTVIGDFSPVQTAATVPFRTIAKARGSGLGAVRDPAPENLVAVGSRDGRVSLWQFY